MALSGLVTRILQQPDLNFVLTNKVPRRQLTRLVGWLSRVEQPLVRDLSIAAWQFFAGSLNLHEARTRRFTSMHDCFIRELQEGARPIDRTPGVLVSPCDAIVGASGVLTGTELIQAKGQPYSLEDLLAGPHLIDRHRGGTFVTLRLTAAMYHRFHAPEACHVDEVTYISGDVWNVNPVTLSRVARLFCKNERAVIATRLLASPEYLTLVPVAAILVASIHLHFLDVTLGLTYDGPSVMPCDTTLAKGEEMGYFHHGSTIIVFGSPGLELCPGVREGRIIRVGEPLLRHATHDPFR